MSILFSSFSDGSGRQMGSLNCSQIHVVRWGAQPALSGVAAALSYTQDAPSHLSDFWGD